MSKQTAPSIQRILEKVIASARFSDRMLYAKTLLTRRLPYARALSKELRTFLTPAEEETVHRRLMRVAFLIEPVNAEVTSTKYAVRWGDRLQTVDPRRATFADCMAIHENLSFRITELLQDEAFRKELQLTLEWGKSPHEFPVDYELKTAIPIHTAHR